MAWVIGSKLIRVGAKQKSILGEENALLALQIEFFPCRHRNPFSLLAGSIGNPLQVAEPDFARLAGYGPRMIR
ncbi:hypothetical protein GCM10020370_23100 [Paenibacillus hodogayensis]